MSHDCSHSVQDKAPWSKTHPVWPQCQASFRNNYSLTPTDIPIRQPAIPSDCLNTSHPELETNLGLRSASRGPDRASDKVTQPRQAQLCAQSAAFSPWTPTSFSLQQSHYISSCSVCKSQKSPGPRPNHLPLLSA